MEYSGGPSESLVESRRWPCRAPVKLPGIARARKSAGLALLREDPLERRFRHWYNPQERWFQNTHTHTRTLAGYPSVGVHTCLCRPYSSTSRRTMPCVEGELCHVPTTSPKPTEAHGCQRGCGGRLHGTCGSIADDNEMHRICSQCLAKRENRKAAAPPKR